MKERQMLQQELIDGAQISKNGWVLVDFPTNFAQSKLLEAALSGYVPNKEEDPIEREK